MDTETKTSPHWPATEQKQLASVSDSSWQPASRWKALWGMKSLTSGLYGLIKSAGLLVDLWGRITPQALMAVGDILMYDFSNEVVGKNRLWLGNRTGSFDRSWLSAAIPTSAALGSWNPVHAHKEELLYFILAKLHRQVVVSHIGCRPIYPLDKQNPCIIFFCFFFFMNAHYSLPVRNW